MEERDATGNGTDDPVEVHANRTKVLLERNSTRSRGIERPGSTDGPGRGSTLSRSAKRRPAPGGSTLAALASEAVAAIDGLAAGRAERDLGILAAG
jgi:hypothetical protein